MNHKTPTVKNMADVISVVLRHYGHTTDDMTTLRLAEESIIAAHDHGLIKGASTTLVRYMECKYGVPFKSLRWLSQM